MAFESAIVEIGTGDTDVYEMPALNDGAVVLSIGNVTGGAVTYDFKFYKQATAVTTQLANDVSVAANSVVKFPMPVAMQAGDKIIMSASAGSSLAAQCTVTRGGAATIVNTISPKGEWNSGASYVIADAVSHDSTSYLAAAANTNSEPQPDGSNSDWMILVEATVGGDFIGPGSSGSGNIVTFGDASGKLGADSGVAVSTDGTLAANSDTKVATQKATKTYADSVAATATSVASIIHAASGKTTPVDADELGLIDSAASNALKKLTLANLKTTLIAAFKAAAAAFWAGSNDATFLTPKTIADAAARVSLTSGTTINTDCSAGRNFKVTLGHNATFAKPTNMQDGVVYTWQINQPSSGGPYTGAFNAAFEFPSTPTLSTAASKKDLVSAMYDADADLLIARFSKGS